MITAEVTRREYATGHVDLWDEFLTYILDDETKDLVNQRGIESVVEQLRLEADGRYGVRKATVFPYNI